MLQIFGNSSTVNNTFTWQPEPNIRGTWSILSTCLTTIFLCVWTAVHLNVPEANATMRPVLRKAGWLILALIAPELVVFVAWHQFIRAGETAEEMNEALARKLQREKNPQVKSRAQSVPTLGAAKTKKARQAKNSKWSRVHGFYINMGGVAFEPPYPKQSFSPFLPPEDELRWTLRLDGIRGIVEIYPELLDCITTSQIMDKSKSSGVSKTIVCTQATWFIIQCLSRFWQSLPVTLLELNTFGHCLCALMMYMLWWSKPLDVTEPTVLRDDMALGFLACMWLAHKGKISNIRSIANPDYTRPVVMPGPKFIQSGEQIYSTGLHFCPPEGRATPPLELSDVDIECWYRAAPIFGRYKDENNNKHRIGWRNDITSLRVRNWPERKPDNDSRMWFILIITGSTYGGLHALAWKAPFHTRTEQLLWQVSTTAIMGYGVAMWLTYRLINMNRRISFDLLKTFHYYFRKMKRFFGQLGSEQISFPHTTMRIKCYVNPLAFVELGDLLLVIVSVLTLLYIFGRVYLVVECFLSLSHAPEGIYTLPIWAAYVPHIV